MQIVSGPIGCYVASVSPHRPDLHAPQRLPDILPFFDFLFIHHHVTVAGDNPRGDGRSLLVDARPDPSQNSEGHYEDDDESKPEPLHFSHPWTSDQADKLRFQ